MRDINNLTARVIGCAIEVHRNLGPGLLESTYEYCLARELSMQNIAFDRQVIVPILYKGDRIDGGYRIDFLIEGRLIVELKAVDIILGIHKAQLLTYLKLAEIPIGLLLNFNVQLLADGICRMRI